MPRAGTTTPLRHLSQSKRITVNKKANTLSKVATSLPMEEITTINHHIAAHLMEVLTEGAISQTTVSH